MADIMSGRITPSGRFIYAGPYKTMERASDRFDDMCCEGEMTPGEGRIEALKQGRRVVGYVITIE